MANQGSTSGKHPGSTPRTTQSKTEQAEKQAEKHVDQAKQKASQATAEAKRQAAKAGEEVKKQVGQATEAVKQQAADTANSLRTKGRKMAHEQKHRVAGEIEACSSALRDAAERYNQESETHLGKYASAAAQQLDRAKSYLEDRQLEGMLSDVERGVRGHRDLVYGACFVAGLGLARFLKASAEKRAAEEGPDGDQAGRRPLPRAGTARRRVPSYRSHVEPRHERVTTVTRTSSEFGGPSDG